MTVSSCLKWSPEQWEKWNLECDIRHYESMLATGHWTIGNQRDFTPSEIAWFEDQIIKTKKKLREMYE